MTDLEQNFESVLKDKEPGVPDHLGFSMETTIALAFAKEHPTPDNIAIARAALKAQINGDHALEKAIQEYIDVQ